MNNAHAPAVCRMPRSLGRIAIRHAQMSRLLLIALLSLMRLALPTAHAQQVSASWNLGTENWSVSANWAPAAVTNNSEGTTSSVTVNVSSSIVTMDLPNDAIGNLTLGISIGGSNTPITNAGDSLTVSGGLNISGRLSRSSNQGTPP
jgi:hypothetical protein